MTLKRLLLAAPLALAIAVLAGTRADAGYSYTTSITYGVPVGAPGTVVNTPGTGAVFTTTNGTVVTMSDIANPGTFIIPGVATYNFGDLSVTTTSATPETFTVPYTSVVTVTNPSPGGATGTFTFTGTLALVNVEFSGGSSGGTVANKYDAPFTQTIPNLNNASFVLFLGTGALNDFFGPPTINNPAEGGNIGGQITAAVVPEPSSVVLGLIGLPALMLLRRRFARA
jgi:hypothetical protein